MSEPALANHNPDTELDVEREPIDDQEVVNILAAYASEAEHARTSGPSPRDTIWRANWDRYWGRYDHSDKADWQSKHAMPEAPQFVDRWAAAMREALDSGGEWFTAEDETGTRTELVAPVNKLMRILLSRCARTPDGHRADFSSVFEDQMKLGALMTCCAAVTWKDDPRGGWVSVDSVDPREVWLDPKMRNLYRRRRTFMDKHELMALAKAEDANGDPLYNVDEIERLASASEQDGRDDRERSAGTGEGTGGAPGRKPIEIDEWLCTLLSADGEVIAQNALCVVANERFLIRGPEPNPFWHEQDWLVETPMVPVPFSPYGRSYMEDWSDVADAFVELTNLILDGVFTSTLKAFAAAPDMLKDATQLSNGISPNKIFELEDGVGIRDFMKEIDLGTLPPEAITVWQALKQELRDGAKLSEIALGQVPPKGQITATEITQVSQAGSAMIRSMARTIESRFLEPVLTLVWQTALQHMDFMDLADELGEEVAAMLQARREEFSESKLVFRVRGISGLVDRQSKLQNLLSFLQVAGQNELLMQALMQKTDPGKILDMLFKLFGVDPGELRLTQAEQLMQQAAQPPAEGMQ